MKKNTFLRTAMLLLVLTLICTSLTFSFTGARFVSRDVASNEFSVYHIISFQYSNTDWGNRTNAIQFNNAPAGEWAFYARGQHGRDSDPRGRPGVLVGIYNKSLPGFFTLGAAGGGNVAALVAVLAVEAWQHLL